MPPRLKALQHNPHAVGLLIAAAAQLLFAAWLDRPHQIMFDEVHYVPAALALLQLDMPHNIEHPLLGKTLIALGIALFGDNPWGWRLVPSLFGAATVAGSFAFLWLLARDMRMAVTGALLVMLNHLVFVLARIAMLDVFVGAFLVWAMVAMLWAAQGTPRQALRRWVLGSLLLGLAMGVKWAAIPYVALAGLAFVVLRARDNWSALFPAGKGVRKPSASGIKAMLAGAGQRHWRGLGTIQALEILGAVSVVVYLATFLPAFFYARDPLTIPKLIALQGEMYALQTQVLQPHPYQSSWWTWPLALRPIWYFYEWDAGAWRGVLLIGNPVVMWGGLVGVAACYAAWARRRAFQPLAMALLWTGSLAIYIVIPKSLGFYYYYYLSGIFICFAIAVALRERRRSQASGWEIRTIGFAALTFVYFYAILAAAPLRDGGGFNDWMWLDSWR